MSKSEVSAMNPVFKYPSAVYRTTKISSSTVYIIKCFAKFKNTKTILLNFHWKQYYYVY